MNPDTWEPGDDLYSEHTHHNSRYLYNWRDSSEGLVCNCADAARWPSPTGCWDLGMVDPFARIIAEAGRR